MAHTVDDTVQGFGGGSDEGKARTAALKCEAHKYMARFEQAVQRRPLRPKVRWGGSQCREGEARAREVVERHKQTVERARGGRQGIKQGSERGGLVCWSNPLDRLSKRTPAATRVGIRPSRVLASAVPTPSASLPVRVPRRLESLPMGMPRPAE